MVAGLGQRLVEDGHGLARNTTQQRGQAPQLGPDARRRRVLEVFRRATQSRSEHETLLIVLEDLHLFDAASVAFLELWLPSFPGTRTLIVTNFRPEFHGRTHPRRSREKVGTRLLGLDAGLGGERGLIFDFLEVPDPDRPHTGSSGSRTSWVEASGVPLSALIGVG